MSSIPNSSQFQFQSRSLDDKVDSNLPREGPTSDQSQSPSQVRPSIAALAHPSASINTPPSNFNRSVTRSATFSSPKPPKPRPSLISNQSSSSRPISFLHLSSNNSFPDAPDPTWRAKAIGSTPLDRTIDAIGMGRYQWALLVLSGCGWAADNMWLQAVAIILPRVQQEWSVDDKWIGLVSSSTFAGMMVGAISWGTYSDSFGRVSAFNHTLLVTSIFGLLSSLSNSFPILCLTLFLLGTGVGGSMPTDGTLFLENLPKRKQYLLTALSVFFAMGSVLSSVLGLIIIPSRSCPENPEVGCDISKQNQGWRYLLASCGVITLIFVIARLVFFRLFESPKFLVANGRSNEARVILQRIAIFNGAPLPLSLSDVRDAEEGSASVSNGTSKANDKSWLGGDRNGRKVRGSNGYQAVPTEVEDLDEVEEEEEEIQAEGTEVGNQQASTRRSAAINQATTSSSTTRRNDSVSSSSANINPETKRESLIESLKSSLKTLSDRYSKLFTKDWKRTTILIFLIWTLISLAYTSFNVFLPKYLESRLASSASINASQSDLTSSSTSTAISLPISTSATNTNPSSSSSSSSSTPSNPDSNSSREAVMFSYVLYALASLPGSLLGAWLIETKMGRIGTLALSVAFTGLSILGFALVESQSGVVISSMIVSVMATTAYAALYGYTPEVFPTSLRATACGAASALSRLAGILAPMLAGSLLTFGGPSLPLFASGITLILTAFCALALPIETRGHQNSNDEDEGQGQGQGQEGAAH